MCVGYHRDLPGGFAERMLAHESQLVQVPDGMPDERAVLIEPLAIGVHAALKRLPAADEKTLVIGGGMIAYSVLAALRALGSKSHVTVLTLLEYQGELARRLGADEVILAGRADFVDEACRITGARRHKPILGPDVLTGGFDVTFDCVGAPESLRDGLRTTASQGTLVLVGAAGVAKLDLTPVWNREVRIVGAVGYGPEPAAGARHTFDLTRELYSGAGGAPMDELVTHRFPLERYQEAIAVNLDRGSSRAIKSVLLPNMIG